MSLEGHHYAVLRGPDLEDFKQLTPYYEGSHTPQLQILYVEGYDRVRLLTRKPMAPRAVMAREGFGQLASR
jgi:hypothetical protein